MSNIDIMIVGMYLAALFAWAIYIGLRETAEDFFVFSRRAPVGLLSFSIIATWVGVGTTIATASSAYQTGISLGLTAASGGLLGAFSAALIAPGLKRFGDRYNAHTIGDFLAVRFAEHTRVVGSLLILAVYLMLTGAQFVGMAALLQVWSERPIQVLMAFAAITTVGYTAFAGIKSDFYTDAVHLGIMAVVLFFVMLPTSMVRAGGWRALAELPASFFDPFAYGGVGFLLGGLAFGAGSVFLMMELWQRIYAASSPRVARQALVFSIAAIIMFYGVSVALGLLGRALLPSLANPDQVLFKMMAYMLPTGLLGLGIAAFLAIIISTLNSTIMVCSAVLTNDLGRAYLHKEKPNQMLWIGRGMTLVSGLAGLLLALALPDLVALSVNGMFLLLVLLPAIAGGYYSKRVTASAATWSVLCGLVTTAVFLTYDASTAFVPGFLVSLVVLVVRSLVSKHDESEDLTVVARAGRHQ